MPLWIKRLVTIVHGLSRKPTVCKPNRKIRSGLIAMAINSKRFIANKYHIGVKSKLLYLIITSPFQRDKAVSVPLIITPEY